MCCRVIHHGNVCICNFHFHDSLTCIFLFSRDLEENTKIMGYMIYHTNDYLKHLSIQYLKKRGELKEQVKIN